MLKFSDLLCAWLAIAGITLFAFAVVTLSSKAFGGQPYPIQQGVLVNDYAGLFTTSEKNNLTQAMAGQNTVILTVPDLNGETIESFSINAAKAAKVGALGKDDGAVVVLGLAERKVRIEVGYGREAELTDTRTKEILVRARLLLAAKKYYEAFLQIVKEIR